MSSQLGTRTHEHQERHPCLTITALIRPAMTGGVCLTIRTFGTSNSKRNVAFQTASSRIFSRHNAPSPRNTELRAGLNSSGLLRRNHRGTWRQLEHSTDHIARVYVAHYLADLQSDAASELEWDFRALNAASEAESAPSGAERIRLLRPSLHLNDARGLHRIGREAEAREQLALAERGQVNLPETGYGYLMRTEITRARADMDSVESLPLPTPIGTDENA
ncbi:MAG: hypothetical protein L0K74_09800 [Acidipropionibacterium acidipropionici]|nr:hypothetical protein [Acidipropionibacterium acidipropionici]